MLNPGTWALLVEAEGVLLVRQGLAGLGARVGGQGRHPRPGCSIDLPPSRLQDYVALLPSAYYEAALLQLRATEACMFRPAAQGSGEK